MRTNHAPIRCKQLFEMRNRFCGGASVGHLSKPNEIYRVTRRPAPRSAAGRRLNPVTTMSPRDGPLEIAPSHVSCVWHSANSLIEAGGPLATDVQSPR